MTPEAAVYSFFAGFGIPAYAATATPSDAECPYITYNLVVGEWGRYEVPMTANVWYRTDSEAEPNAKVREIADSLGLGGKLLPCDGGAIWLKKGSPWAQSVRVEGEDDKVKRRYLNFTAEYMVTE